MQSIVEKKKNLKGKLLGSLLVDVVKEHVDRPVNLILNAKGIQFTTAVFSLIVLSFAFS